MSHIRGVKVERRIIVPDIAAQRGIKCHPYRRLNARATSGGYEPGGRHQAIAAF
jgi:hypothetical protein